MAGEKQENPWPVPKFHFQVTIDGLDEQVSFQEVSGLDTEYDMMEYRSGDSIDFSTIKMPGLRKSSDVTLKKGMFLSDTSLFDYFMKVKMNTIIRSTVTISLLNEEHDPLFTWTLKNAWPMKVSGTDLNAQNSEVAVEEIVLAHEGLTFAKV
ncbi:phage tail-like protein [Neolewinella xylanilytica]|uniref:Phage tail-like protein n=1 Tax=Neolewinella xylanilytica TaxID=1514080 RepID=A0A2S6I998_9BACT|nr:phage tail protein [Neolewinella xylanilytica]PPK88076.1 phage tail-like protein [Neolewinella xylanilytica]